MISPESQREFAVDVVRRLQQAGYTALWAGGCVRDLLLGLPAQDYDVATSARPEQVQELFGPRKTLAIGASFGVILVRGPRGAGDVEVATFRTEGPYLDGRRPEHVSFATPEEDALRRDFTINGMFYDPLTQQVRDYVGGQEDLTRKIVRAIGDPHARFREDKLRMLRAVRIAARFNYALDPETSRAIQEMAGETLVVSRERIAQELKKMIVHPNRRRAVELAHELCLLTIILPELKPICESPDSAPWQTTLRMLDLLHNPSFELALATLLLEGIVKRAGEELSEYLESKIAKRIGKEKSDPENDQLRNALVKFFAQNLNLRLSNREIDHVTWLLEHRDALRDAPALPRAKLKRLLAHPLIADLLTFLRVSLTATQQDLASVEFCEQYLQNTPPEEINPPPLLTGDDLIRHGLQPGAQFKELLEQVRDAQLEGTISTAEEALRLVDKRQNENQLGGTPPT